MVIDHISHIEKYRSLDPGLKAAFVSYYSTKMIRQNRLPVISWMKMSMSW